QIAAKALSAHTKQEAIDVASRILTRQLAASKIGVVGKHAADIGEFLATSAAIHGAAEGMAISTDEPVKQGLVFIALTAPEIVGDIIDVPRSIAKYRAEQQKISEGQFPAPLALPEGFGQPKPPPDPYQGFARDSENKVTAS